jgi:hypothetical protein
MLRDAANEAEVEIGPVASWGLEQRSVPGADWRRVDRALRAVLQHASATPGERGGRLQAR